jgi:hypothetical protein
MTDDDSIQLIENFAFDAGPVVAERRNRGFTLIDAETGVPVARLRSLGRNDLYGSIRISYAHCVTGRIPAAAARTARGVGCRGSTAR